EAAAITAWKVTGVQTCALPISHHPIRNLDRQIIMLQAHYWKHPINESANCNVAFLPIYLVLNSFPEIPWDTNVPVHQTFFFHSRSEERCVEDMATGTWERRHYT